MLVHVKSDNHIVASEGLVEWVTTELTGAFERFEPQLTRLEVGFTDENSHKEGTDDKRCVLEARLSGLEPIVTRGSGATLEQALDGATDKLTHALDHRLGRIADKKGRVSFGGESE